MEGRLWKMRIPLTYVYAGVHTRYVHWLVHTWWWMAGVSLEGESPSYTFAFLCTHTNANLYAGGGCWISDMSTGKLYFSIEKARTAGLRQSSGLYIGGGSSLREIMRLDG